MKEVKTQAREWGRSLGLVIPRETVLEEEIKPGDTVQMFIVKKRNPLAETFGKLKFKKSTDEMLKESDREAWDE